MIKNYEDAIKYINAIPWTSRSVGLHRINELLDELGRPDKDIKFIHVAGTNGKGSTCAMLVSVLKEAGYKTGLFTSPHLIKYNERMKINDVEISDADLADMIQKVAGAVERIGVRYKKNGREYETPSEFEVLTAAGLLWFNENRCDIVVLEVGLGGEFDSTNAIKGKEVAVITPIGFDHTAILGNTLGKIASAKAGIITEACDVVCSLQSRDRVAGNEYPSVEQLAKDMEILNVISDRCKNKHARLHIPDTVGFKTVSKDIEGLCFRSRYYDEPLRLNLIGEYQLVNALTVLEIIRVLNKKSYNIDENAVRRGLEKVRWAARFEVLSKSPVFILDGAHNEHGIDAAVDALRYLFGEKKIIYILGILSDKNVDAMLAKLYTNAKSFITLTPESERALAGEKLAERLRKAGFPAVNFDTAKDAVSYALGLAGKERQEEVICSLGSLYLAGEIRSCFDQSNP